MSGKIPSFNRLFKSVLRENDIGVEISEINFPGFQQYEEKDCFIALNILSTYRGELLIF